MPIPKPNPFDNRDIPATPSLRIRERPSDGDDEGTVREPGESNALLARLAQEVAALRSALDASRHRIARLEVEAAEDPVSGLLNQRALLREIEKAIEFRSRFRADVAVALISVDGMSGVAERHGQPVVRRVLRTMGERLRGSIRSCDVAARIEPYQFAAVLWNASPDDCARRLDLIRAALGGMDRLLEGRVAAVRIRAVATAIEASDSAVAVLARAEGQLAELPGRPVRR